MGEGDDESSERPASTSPSAQVQEPVVEAPGGEEDQPPALEEEEEVVVEEEEVEDQPGEQPVLVAAVASAEAEQESAHVTAADSQASERPRPVPKTMSADEAEAARLMAETNALVYECECAQPSNFHTHQGAKFCVAASIRPEHHG